ncbi:uncharacterized protein B0H18DRAFT_1006526 [Fomitopsis serialis]|uniref:uncharacterized protein n=1 Tax=Fomitopsis serialis TaxID=139415 RepID=UPI002008D602|nr:uncharacterized protein B0H18DRAFT_1006526 [Neoantrodia serialis]KAH9926095.1 hypothetical protein B0H18DRAFT_1006526 [Neoantrodia serialis]
MEDSIRPLHPEERVAHLEKEKAALEKRVQNAEHERALLNHKCADVFRSEASILAAEAPLYPPNTILFDEGFVPRPTACTNTKTWLGAIPQEASGGRTLFFLPRPPNCLPIRVPGWAKSGYWFHPEGAIVGEREFELIIETKHNEWCYVGRYRSTPVSGGNMQLSEWIEIDEATKVHYVGRVQSEVFGQSGLPGIGQMTVQAIRKNYDTGVWSIPCYSLQCVGYSRALYAGLQFASRKTATVAG